MQLPCIRHVQGRLIVDGRLRPHHRYRLFRRANSHRHPEGLRVYQAEGDAPLVEIQPPPLPNKYWTRRGVAEWLVERLAGDTPALVGIDHGFSFPLPYAESL